MADTVTVSKPCCGFYTKMKNGGIDFLEQDGYQNRYFVLKSFKDGAHKLREYCSEITPPDIMARFLNKATPALHDDPRIRPGQF